MVKQNCSSIGNPTRSSFRLRCFAQPKSKNEFSARFVDKVVQHGLYAKKSPRNVRGVAQAAPSAARLLHGQGPVYGSLRRRRHAPQPRGPAAWPRLWRSGAQKKRVASNSAFWKRIASNSLSALVPSVLLVVESLDAHDRHACPSG